MATDELVIPEEVIVSAIIPALGTRGKASMIQTCRAFKRVVEKDSDYQKAHDDHIMNSLDVSVYEKKEDGLFHQCMVRCGDVLAYNVLWSAGMHYNYEFYEVTKITAKKRVMGRLLEKVYDRARREWSHHYTRDYVSTSGVRVTGKKAKKLKGGTYFLVTPQLDLYDGGCVY